MGVVGIVAEVVRQHVMLSVLQAAEKDVSLVVIPLVVAAAQILVRHLVNILVLQPVEEDVEVIVLMGVIAPVGIHVMECVQLVVLAQWLFFNSKKYDRLSYRKC